MKPFASIDEARIAARSIEGSEVTIQIHGGHYVLRNGIALTAADSGSVGRPIRYSAMPGEVVRISSGVTVPATALKPVTDETIRTRFPEEVRDRVRAISLGEQGLSAKPFPNNFRGLDLLEVFSDGKRLPLARWPGNGRFARIETVTDNGIRPPSTGTFVYREEEPGRWTAALQDGLWIRGFWRVPWVIESVRVGSIDPSTRSITLASPVSGGIGSKYKRGKDGTGPGSGDEPWEAINLIEAIRSPGDWAVRFDDQTLYLIPPDGGGELLITDHREPVFGLSDVSHVTLENLIVDSGLGAGIRVTGGEGVTIAGCKVSNVAGSGIVLKGGSHHLVLSCDIRETGYSGISFLGGERRTLTPGNHRILNNIVSRAGCYFPAPGIDGGLGCKAESVGNLVAFNRIHDSANSGIVYSGNENVFEYNDIYRIGLGSSDLGCFYTTGGWTSRGNVVRFNLVHHSMNANAFYLDDGDSGDTFFGNVAYRTESGGFVGGGHDQIFRNNLIVESTRAMHVDSRGVARNYTVDDKRLRGDLDSVPYASPPWSDKYPELLKILEIRPEFPSGILIEGNVFVRCNTAVRRSGKEGELDGVEIRDNVVTDDLGIFENVEALDFTLKPDGPVFAAIPTFEQIPWEKIGPYPDAYRPVVPARDMELLKTGNTESGFDSQTDVDASNKRPNP